MLIHQNMIIYQQIHCVYLKMLFCFESIFFSLYLLEKKNACKLYILTAVIHVKIMPSI